MDERRQLVCLVEWLLACVVTWLLGCLAGLLLVTCLLACWVAQLLGRWAACMLAWLVSWLVAWLLACLLTCITHKHTNRHLAPPKCQRTQLAPEYSVASSSIRSLWIAHSGLNLYMLTYQQTHQCKVACCCLVAALVRWLCASQN